MTIIYENYLQKERTAFREAAPKRKFNLLLGLKRNFSALKRNFSAFNDFMGIIELDDFLWFYGFIIVSLSIPVVFIVPCIIQNGGI